MGGARAGRGFQSNTTPMRSQHGDVRSPQLPPINHAKVTNRIAGRYSEPTGRINNAQPPSTLVVTIAAVDVRFAFDAQGSFVYSPNGRKNKTLACTPNFVFATNSPRHATKLCRGTNSAQFTSELSKLQPTFSTAGATAALTQYVFLSILKQVFMF